MKWNANDMPIFVAVIDSGGFSAAAKKLEMPKSTISRSISRLEADLDIRLLERNSRNLRLTSEGEKFYHHCQLVIEQLDATRATISGFKQVPSGRLSVSLPTGFNYEFIQDQLSQFLALYPQIQLDLKISQTHLDLYTGDIDVAVQIGPLPDSELIAIHLLDSPQIWVTSPQYFDQNEDALQPSQLSFDVLRQHSKIQLLHPRKYHFKLRHDGNEYTMFDPPMAQCNDALTVKKAVMTGCGIAVLPKVLVQSAINKKELVQIAHAFEIMPQTALYAVYPSNKYLSEKTRLFITFLKQAIKDNTQWNHVP
ncbi:LysR family transcriptional regulator [Photobacterium makurazakiensis]|uniref:LysR family transcriptional regulator n=1 Tax=Photobacterium makurazakiensis TaxID=2910234 RepID=UPI003D140E87